MEANVIYRIAKGDEMAFDAFMDYYSSTLYRHAYGVVANKELAEEIVSDVFYYVWKQRKQLLEVESMGAWLHTLTYRRAVSVLRHELSRPGQVDIDELENFAISVLETPDETMMSREDTDRLNHAIEELPPKCRHVFSLAKIEGLPYKEIARLLDISVATINYHISYAMDHLKRRLRPPSG